MTRWQAISFFGAKHHIVPIYLAQTIIDDLRERGCELDSQLATLECYVDQPGMMAMNRPDMDMYIEGLNIQIPCEDVASFVLQIQDHKRRGTDDVPYYKVHGRASCLVFTPTQFAEFKAKLSKALPDAEAQAAEFWAGKKVYSEVLRDANGGGDKNFGGNKMDRFKMGPGVKA